MESYDYTSKDRLEAEREDREMEEYWNKRPVKNRLGTQGDTEVSMEDDRPDLRASHAQQPAADDDFFDTKPSVRDRLEIKPNVRDRLGESGDNRGSYRKRGSRGQVTEADMYSDVKKRLGRKPDCNSSNFRMGTTKYVALKADDSVEKIVNGLCVNLNEPKVALMGEFWISNHIHYEMWNGITYLIPNFNSFTVEVCVWIHPTEINPLKPSDSIWRHGIWSTWVQFMACCLMKPSHYLNQCWFIVN